MRILILVVVGVLFFNFLVGFFISFRLGVFVLKVFSLVRTVWVSWVVFFGFLGVRWVDIGVLG